MIIKKTTIYELEQSGIILDDPCEEFISDENSQGYYDEMILQLFDEANQMPMEDCPKYFTFEDYYPTAVHQQNENIMLK